MQRKTEAVEARIGPVEPPDDDEIELRIEEVEQRVTVVEGRVDKLVADDEAVKKANGK